MDMDNVGVESPESSEVGMSGDFVHAAGIELRRYQTPQLRRFSTPQLIQYGNIQSVVQAAGGTGADAGSSSFS